METLFLIPQIMFHLWKVKVLPRPPFENVQNVQTRGLEMGRGVVRGWNEELRGLTRVQGFVVVRDGHEPVGMGIF